MRHYSSASRVGDAIEVHGAFNIHGAVKGAKAMLHTGETRVVNLTKTDDLYTFKVADPAPYEAAP